MMVMKNLILFLNILLSFLFISCLHGYEGVPRYDYPSVSPDGNWIACILDYDDLEISPPEPEGIYLVSIDGREKIFLDFYPYSLPGSQMWSPGGNQIVLQYSIRTLQDNKVVGSRFTKEGPMKSPCWSPNDNILLWGSFSGEYICLCDTLFQSVRTLPMRGSNAKWMPNGAEIIYNDHEGICISDTLGNNKIRLTNNMLDQYPSCSPDGSTIVWNRNEEIYLMDKNGSNQRYLAEGIHPTWTPDSKSIVYAKSAHQNNYSYFLWKIGINDNKEVQITK
jgi:Tol biopolymer transport system component